MACLLRNGRGAELRLVDWVHVLRLVEPCPVALAAADNALHECRSARASRSVEVLPDLDVGHVTAANRPTPAHRLDLAGCRNYLWPILRADIAKAIEETKLLASIAPLVPLLDPDLLNSRR